MEAEGAPCGLIQAAPVQQGLLQQDKGADDIGVDELTGAIDRAVHMAFRRQMHDRVGLETFEQGAQGRPIGDIDPLEGKAGMVRDRREGGEIARIGQFIDHADRMRRFGDQFAHQRRADKARAACNQYLQAHPQDKPARCRPNPYRGAARRLCIGETLRRHEAFFAPCRSGVFPTLNDGGRPVSLKWRCFCRARGARRRCA